MASLDAGKLQKQREQVYTQMLKTLPNIEVDESTTKKIAERALFAIRHLSVGKTAPEITGQDVYGLPMKLSEFRGKVVMLSFWGHW